MWHNRHRRWAFDLLAEQLQPAIFYLHLLNQGRHAMLKWVPRKKGRKHDDDQNDATAANHVQHTKAEKGHKTRKRKGTDVGVQSTP